MKTGDEQRDDRVRERRACRAHDGAGDDDAKRRGGIAEHVNGRAPDVDVALRASVEPEADREVEDDGGRSDADHQAARREPRRLDAFDGLPPDEERDGHERHRIDERGKHADTVIAVGHALM